ncbi:PA14 domain-containing protein [Tundrisphaera sp. TA3]|uniref:PA14 domain-containing protein n=1 Tax=Tundrisphaera sp. TA3 TaxID=3435775 RepID=UPI003EC11863
MSDAIRRPALLLALGLTLAARARAESLPQRPVVAGYERFHTGSAPGPGPVAAGRLLLGELNCTSCHQGPGADAAGRKQAPILDRVGSRVRVEHLRQFLAAPHATRPGTTMPDLVAGLPEPGRQAVVEDLVHFLAGTGKVTDTPPSRAAVRSGRGTYARVGCVACHGPREGKATEARGIVPLGDPAAKYTVASLSAFLRDPLAVRPSGRMPGLGLTPDEATGIAAYLLKDVQVASSPNVAYRYYEGSWTNLPDFDALTPVASGMASGFDIDVARRRNNFALRFEGILEILREGDYTFRFRSDDGSRITLNGTKVFDNDGIHPTSEATGITRMKPGRNTLVATYFDGGGQVEFEAEIEGPGMPRQPLGPLLLPPEGSAPDAPARPAPPRFVVDPERATRGRAAFASLGCASCHALRMDESPIIEARPPATPLSRLRPEAGCLADEPPASVPAFHLDAGQREALRSAIALSSDPAAQPTGPERIASTMLAANCYACHRRDGRGGVEEALNPAFQTTQTEMGDEGRIPPGLDGVGGKLTAAWLAQILAEGAKDRPYMLTRMPRFGAANVGHLAGLFEAADALPPVAAVDLGVTPRKARAIGRSLVGNTGFSCGSCHTFKGIEASGIQAIDMTRMTARLRREWFAPYVIDPQRFRPGTRMPTSFPDGKSTLESVLDGDPAKQVEAIWTYLSDGPKAEVPAGIGRNPMPLIAVSEPILYRNFIQGAGPRAIGVGYPEKANLAFDAQALRLALIWRGGFIDASRHWTGRGEGFEPPLGDDVLSLGDGPGFARLAGPADPWPGAPGPGDRFRGYRLAGGKRPVFLYEVAGAAIEDHPEPAPGGGSPTLRRTIDVAGPRAEGLAFRAAVAGKIEPAGDGWFAIDGEWKLRIVADAAPVVRASGGKAELIVPIGPGGVRTRIVEEFAW